MSTSMDVLFDVAQEDRPEMDLADFFESGRYTLSVNYQPVMQGVKLGRYALADPSLPLSQLACGYCGHALRSHFTSTSVMTTSVGCGRCSHDCIIWQHFDRGLPIDSVIGYEREAE